MKRAIRPALLLATVGLTLGGCSSHSPTASLSTTSSSRLAEHSMPLSTGDGLGFALYNTQRGMLARGYTDTPVPLPAVATVPTND